MCNLALNARNKFERKISEKWAVRAGKGFTLFISIEDMNDIIKIIKSVENLGVLTDRVTETVKHEIKIPLGASVMEPVIFSVVISLVLLSNIKITN